jgi:hypothetical protein
MLTVRSCNDCGRRVRLSSSIQPPKCPACRLPDLRPITDSRPCLRCQVPIPTGDPNPLCVNCQYAPTSCLYCQSDLVHRRGVTYCSICSSGRRTIVLPAVDFGPIYSTSFDPSVNSFQSPSAPQRKRQRLNLPSIEPSLVRVGSPPRESYLVNQALGFLGHEYDSRAHASLVFPAPVTDSQIRLSVARFETELAIAAMDTICSSCGRLVYTTETRRVFANDPLLLTLKDDLDSCGWSDGCWNICSLCYAALLRGSVPKFSMRNKINVTLCQHYPDVLKDLTLTEEYLIAKSHPVGVILKLRPGGRSSPANYHALRGHFIIIPQNPKPLLQILPSPELQLTELVKVFWMGRQPPTDQDLRPFLVVTKNRVLAALRYLIQHNPLYQDVAISHSTLENWPDDFVPSALQQDIICLDETDLDERAGYSVDLRGGNYENDWQAANDARESFTEDSIPVTASVTVDLNGDRYNPDLRLLSTIQSLNDQSPCETTRPQLISTAQIIQETSSSSSHHRSPVIEYGIRGQALLLNQWEDPHYFTSAFPTLFPTGRGGHLDDRHVVVSLAAFF